MRFGVYISTLIIISKESRLVLLAHKELELYCSLILVVMYSKILLVSRVCTEHKGHSVTNPHLGISTRRIRPPALQFV